MNDAGLGGLRVHVRKEAVHPQPIIVAGEGEECRPEVIEVVVHPGARLDDAPPTVVFFGYICHRSRFGVMAFASMREHFLIQT
jgi:hypothetical protein